MTEAPAPKPRVIPLSQILRMRETWGCILSRVLTDPVSYFLYFWMPKYLQDVHGLDLAQTGKYGWIPFVALAAGSVTSGAVPRILTARGWGLDRARKTWMLVVTASIPVSCLLLTRVNGVGLADVPKRAISMSVRQILKAKEILCIVPDARKAAAVKDCLEGAITPLHPASILRTHANVTLFLDKGSASLLNPITP